MEHRRRHINKVKEKKNKTKALILQSLSNGKNLLPKILNDNSNRYVVVKQKETGERKENS